MNGLVMGIKGILSFLSAPLIGAVSLFFLLTHIWYGSWMRARLHANIWQLLLFIVGILTNCTEEKILQKNTRTNSVHRSICTNPCFVYLFFVAAIGCMGTKILFVNYRFLYMRANSSNDHKYLVRFIYLYYIIYFLYGWGFWYVIVVVVDLFNTYGRPKTAYCVRW